MNADLQSLVVILVAAALAPLVVDLPSRFRLPAIVAEITLGILVGPQVLGFAEAEGVVEFLSTVGLAFLYPDESGLDELRVEGADPRANAVEPIMNNTPIHHSLGFIPRG